MTVMREASSSRDSLTPSAARPAASSYGRATVSAASARCTTVSCVSRRSQKPARRSCAHVHTVDSAPVSATAQTRFSAPLRSQSPCFAGCSGSTAPGTDSKGMNLVVALVMMAVAQ
jgi:esterase/lipase superfamily enzyme